MSVAVVVSFDSASVGGAVVVPFTSGVDSVDTTPSAGDVDNNDNDDNNNKHK